MKIKIERKGIGTCLILWILLSLFLVDADAQQEAPMIGPGPMRMPVMGLRGPGRIEARGLEVMLHIWQSYFFLQRHPLRLTGDQSDKIESILNDQERSLTLKNADRKILLIDIRQLLVREPIDLKKVEEKVKALEALNAEIIMAEIETLEKALAVLTPEQRQKMLSLFKESRFTGPFGP
jgi:Spy/CpxP family protein refolding chaperone